MNAQLDRWMLQICKRFEFVCCWLKQGDNICGERCVNKEQCHQKEELKRDILFSLIYLEKKERRKTIAILDDMVFGETDVLAWHTEPIPNIIKSDIPEFESPEFLLFALSVKAMIVVARMTSEIEQIQTMSENGK